MSVLEVVPIYLSGVGRLVEDLTEELESTFRKTVRVQECWFDPETCYDRSRGQYHSTGFLQQLLTNQREPGSRVLGVTSVDLFIPILTFVFGEAQVGGAAAVVSTHRLRNEVYGLPPDPELLVQRLEKEANHELGHTFGLIHCLHPTCVMRSSTYAEEIDIKDPGFCDSCLRILREA